MVTVESIALCLYRDAWFRHSKSSNKIAVTDESGNMINIPRSYYHTFETGEQIIVRVSEHGTSLETWLRRRQDPSKSLQNLSVVFSNEPVASELKTQPMKVVDADGNVSTQYTYFVVEQYVYRMDSIGMKDFQKVIKKIKKLDKNTVFTDPLKKKPSKFASRTVLQPQDSEGNTIQSSTNPVHSRQTVVVGNKEKEVDAQGNIIPESLLRSIIRESIRRILKEQYYDKLQESKQKCGTNGYYIEKNGLPITYKGQQKKSIISVVHKSKRQAYHICEDDHCYVFYTSTDGIKNAEKYENPYIFDELLEAIKMLPIPS